MSARRRTRGRGREGTSARLTQAGPAHPREARGSTAWIVIALIAGIAIVFAPVRGYGFVSLDDQVYLVNNPPVRAGLTWAGVQWAFTTSYAANWHPLTWLSHMLDVELFDLRAGAHHVVNVVLHGLNTVLLLALLRGLTGSTWRSALVAGLFAWHPLHVESVAWVAERKDVLSTFFGLLAMLAYLLYVRTSRRSHYALALLCLALGLLAKPMLVTLPFVLLLLDFWPLGRGRHLREKLPFVVLAAASSVATILAQRAGGAVATLDEFTFGTRVSNALVAYVVYLRKTIWPLDLAVFYPHQRTAHVLGAAAAAMALAAVTVAVARARRGRPYLLVGWLWFVGMLVPVIGLVQVGVQPVADRYTYLPHVGLFVAAVWAAGEIAGRLAVPSRARLAAAAVVLVACGVLARRQVDTWRDDLALWRHATAAAPGNSRAHANLGVALVAAGRVDEAIAQYETAIRLEPTLTRAQNNLGLALASRGQTERALGHFREAIRVQPGYAEAHHNLANALMDLGRTAEAVTHYREALRLNPAEAQAHHNLGTALASQDRLAEATDAFLAAVRLEPDRAEWHYAAGVALGLQGRAAEAVPHLQRALQLDPRHGGARRALDELTRPRR